MFKLNLKLDWREIFEDKVEQQKIRFTLDGGRKIAKSPAGVPLLNLCIMDEPVQGEDKEWLLKDYGPREGNEWILRDLLTVLLENQD